MHTCGSCTAAACTKMGFSSIQCTGTCCMNGETHEPWPGNWSSDFHISHRGITKGSYLPERHMMSSLTKSPYFEYYQPCPSPHTTPASPTSTGTLTTFWHLFQDSLAPLPSFTTCSPSSHFSAIPGCSEPPPGQQQRRQQPQGSKKHKARPATAPGNISVWPRVPGFISKL